MGRLFDPIADKMLLCSTVISIILISKDYFIGLMGMLILLREFWVSGLREYSALNQMKSASDVTYLAKIKTTLQFIAIGSYLFSFSYGLSLGIFISSFILFLSLLVSLKTGLCAHLSPYSSATGSNDRKLVYECLQQSKFV